MDKAIALAVNFKSAPQELQDAASALDAAAKKLNKANKAQIDNEAQIDILQADRDAKETNFRKILNAWDPDAVAVKA